MNGVPINTTEWHQQGHSGDFIVNFFLKKKTLFTILYLNK